MALRQALTMEKTVTEHIKKIIDYCADAEDHHVRAASIIPSAGWLALNPHPLLSSAQLADYLTGEFMEEQLKGHRKLAGYINTLNRLLAKQPRLANYLFDKQLN